MRLRGGFETSDPRLDRLPQPDERNRNYPVMATLRATTPRSYTWSCPVRLDQGNEGACVGFSWAQELAARPFSYEQEYDDARSIYCRAQVIDPWQGGSSRCGHPPPDYEGTSVLAGAKVVKELGLMREYRWAWSVEELALAVGHQGPAVLGVDWWSGMFRPDSEGYVHPTGYIAGGHAILCNGVNFKAQRFKLVNSWGRDWGLDGTCFVSFADMETLLASGGDACIPVGRGVQKLGLWQRLLGIFR